MSIDLEFSTSSKSGSVLDSDKSYAGMTAAPPAVSQAVAEPDLHIRLEVRNLAVATLWSSRYCQLIIISRRQSSKIISAYALLMCKRLEKSKSREYVTANRCARGSVQLLAGMMDEG
jgi:hypothetical protein